MSAPLIQSDGSHIAYLHNSGAAPGLMFLPGFRSDMTGNKALAVAALAHDRGLAMTRFDYRGHGCSGGDFMRLGIGDWLSDTLLVLDRVTTGPQILIGSSMGGWLALLAALRRPGRLAGLVLIAPAPDFTERLMWRRFPEETRQAILAEGHYLASSDYDSEPYPITRHLIEDGRRHLLLDAPIPLTCPVRILHGRRDPDVPPALSLLLSRRLESGDVVLSLIKDGDHRLSRDVDIALIEQAIAGLSRRAIRG